MEMTETWRDRQTRKEYSIFRLPKIPISKRDFSLRTLKAWISWEQLSTAKAMVRPAAGASAPSKNTRPMVKASREIMPMKQPSMAML